MLLTVSHVLNDTQIEHVKSILGSADWVDGNVTSGYQAAREKNNRQVAEGTKAHQEAGEIILTSLARHQLFLSAALPLRIFPPLFNRYDSGQSFGTHVDNAVRNIPGTPLKIRTDISMTLFLNQPDEYDGGELCVEDTYGVHKVKLPAGCMVLYPSTSLHYVTPVTRGSRICSFFWLQSMIRDDGKRTLLFDMDQAMAKISRDHPRHAGLVQLTGVYHNLIRQWAEM